MNQRIRSIKPEMWSDDKVRLMSPALKLMLVQLITYADDHGRFRADAGGIAAFCDPDGLESDPVAVIGSVKALLFGLAEARIVQIYEVNGCRYGALVNWAKHQKIDKPSASRFPAPPADAGQFARPSRDPRETLANESRAPRETLAPGSRIMDQDLGSLPPTPLGGDEGEGEQDQGYYSERGGNRPAPTPAPPPVEPVVEPPLPDDGPPPRDHPLFQRALRLLEQRLIDCAPVTQRRGKVLTLGSVALGEIANMLTDYGPQALFDRLPECAGADWPLKKLQASIKADPPPKIHKSGLTVMQGGQAPARERCAARDLTPAQRARNVLRITETFLGEVEEAVAKAGEKATPEQLARLAKLRAEAEQARENLARVTAGAA